MSDISGNEILDIFNTIDKEAELKDSINKNEDDEKQDKEEDKSRTENGSLKEIG